MTLDIRKGSTRPFSYTKTKMKIYSSTHFTLGCLPHNKDKKKLTSEVQQQKIYIPIVFMEIGATLEVTRSITYSGTVYWAQSTDGHGEPSFH